MSVHDEKDPPIPALFLAWMPKNWLPGSGDGFAVTFSDGRTSIFGTRRKEITEVNSLTELGSFDARQPIEVWFVALATYQENDRQDAPRISYMFTGNDFGSLHTRRLKTGPGLEEDDEDGISPLSLLLDYDDRARHHTSGVTSILPLPGPLFEGAPLLLTGSYDEYLRVYHASMKGRVLAEVCLGGGVWRLQLLRTEKPSEDGAGPWHWLVLASCMHGGTRVVRVTWRGDEWDMGILVEFTEHESMNYASDAWKGSQDGLVCVSSSFYDRRVCLWRADV